MQHIHLLVVNIFRLREIKFVCIDVAKCGHVHNVESIFIFFKDRDSTVPKRGSVFIGLTTPDSAIWSRYQRAVLMR